MTFRMGNINFAATAAGYWQLEAGRFPMGESCFFQNKVKKTVS